MLAALIAILPLAVPLSYETKAARVPVILQELAKITGLKVEADSSFRNDVLVIRADKVVPDDLLNRIARATTGQWDKVDSRLVLKPDPVRRKQQEEERMGRRVEKIQNLLDAIRGELDEPYFVESLDKVGRTFDPSQAIGVDDRYYAFQAQKRLNPEARLMVRILLKLGSKRLAAIERGARVVYCTRPTSLQKPLEDMDPILQMYRSEVEKFDTAAAGWQPETRLQLQGDLVKKNTGWAEEPILWISVPDILSQIYDGLAMGLDAPDGKVLVRNGVHLQTKPATTQAPPVDSLPETQLGLETESKEIALALAALRKPVRTPMGKAPVVSKLMDPLNFEPLAWGSEIYLQYAKACGVNLVALLNDNSFGRFFGIERITTRTFDTLSRPFMVYEPKDGWLILTPSEPATARWSRDDRKAMGALLRDAFEDNHLCLDAQAAYTLTKPRGTMISLGSKLAALGDPARGGALFWQEDGYRLFATLSPGQKSKPSLTYSELTAAQRALLGHIAFDSRVSLGDIRGASLQQVMSEPSEGRALNTFESTCTFPMGIPGAAQLLYSDTNGMGLTPLFTGSTLVGVNGTMEVESIAMDMFFEKHPELVEGSGIPAPKPYAYQPTQVRRVSIALGMGTHYWSTCLLDEVPVGPPCRTVEEMPVQQREAIQKRLAQFEKQLAEGNPPRLIRGTGQQKPPPPRS